MKLQFKQQQFQKDAVQSVVNCFEGQTLKTNCFTLERSGKILLYNKINRIFAD